MYYKDYFDKFGGEDEFGEDEEPEDEKKTRIQQLVSGNTIARADYIAQTGFVYLVQIVLCLILIAELVKNANETIALYPATF